MVLVHNFLIDVVVARKAARNNAAKGIIGKNRITRKSQVPIGNCEDTLLSLADKLLHAIEMQMGALRLRTEN